MTTLANFQALIRCGGDVNCRKDVRSRPAEYKGHTLLMIAAAKGYLNTLRALVEAGADVKATNPSGDSAAAQYLASAALLSALPPFRL